MAHSYVRHDSFICVPSLIHGSFKCETWLIHMCATTHSYVIHMCAILDAEYYANKTVAGLKSIHQIPDEVLRYAGVHRRGKDHLNWQTKKIWSFGGLGSWMAIVDTCRVLRVAVSQFGSKGWFCSNPAGFEVSVLLTSSFFQFCETKTY